MHLLHLITSLSAVIVSIVIFAIDLSAPFNTVGVFLLLLGIANLLFWWDHVR